VRGAYIPDQRRFIVKLPSGVMAAEIELLEEALKASPGNWKTRRFLIDHWVEKGDEIQAAALVKEAPELPEDEEGKLFAAEILGKTDADEAHKILDEVLAANSGSSSAHLAKARLYLDGGDIANAETQMKMATGEEVAEEPEAPEEEEEIAVAVAVDEDDSEEEAVAAVAVEEESDSEAERPRADGSTPVKPRSLRPPAVDPTDPNAEASSAPAKPRSLRPPGAPDEEEEEEELVAAGAVAAGAAVALSGEAGEAGDGTGPVGDGERAFIVAEGEAIAVHEKDDDTKEKVSALTAALLVHVAIALLLTLYVITVPRQAPPQFSVQGISTDDSDDISSEKVQKMMKTKASPVAAAMPVLSVAAFSPIAIPEVLNATDDLALVSMSSDTGTGFGMSMGGFGNVSNMGSIPRAMRSRCSMSERMKRLRESGGDPNAERVVRNALEWLAKTQNKDGSWGKDHKCAMTGVALLAFLGHCETPESPKYGDTVVNAALYLMDRGLKNKGKLWNLEVKGGSAYTHGMAAYGLAELYTMTKESGREIPRLESVLRKASAVIVQSL